MEVNVFLDAIVSRNSRIELGDVRFYDQAVRIFTPLRVNQRRTCLHTLPVFEAPVYNAKESRFAFDKRNLVKEN